MDVFSELLVLLIVARLCGEALERLGQPASVGEITAGIVLAIAIVWFGDALPFLNRLASSEVLTTVANVGIFALVLLAGIEMEPREIADNTAGSIAVAAGGLLVPLVGGVGLAWLFLPDSELKHVQALMTGVALSISAIPATVKVLTDFGLLHTRIGQTVVAAAVFDDVLGVFGPDAAEGGRVLCDHHAAWQACVSACQPRAQDHAGHCPGVQRALGGRGGVRLVGPLAGHALDHRCLHGRTLL
jgi:Kef-type K+ transport system membrane component KefB